MIDYAELKSKVSIQQVCHLLGLHTIEHGAQLRSPCPACKSGGERAIVITPEKGLFYCFAGTKGGDVLSFVAHIRGCSIKEAGIFLQSDVPEATQKAEDQGGLPAPFCKQTGIAFAKQKDMEESVKVTWKKPAKVPMRTDTGEILGYLFLETAMVSKGVV